MMGATRTPSREEFARFSDPYRTDSFRLLDFRIDGFLEGPFVFATIERRRQDAGQIVALDRSFGADPVTFMFGRESFDAETVDHFNSALAELRESGKHQELLDEYLE